MAADTGDLEVRGEVLYYAKDFAKLNERQRSAGERCRVRAMLFAEAMRLAWLSGTILGREVVPDVCSTRATDRSLTSSMPSIAYVLYAYGPPLSSFGDIASYKQYHSMTYTTADF